MKTIQKVFLLLLLMLLISSCAHRFSNGYHDDSGELDPDFGGGAPNLIFSLQISMTYHIIILSYGLHSPSKEGEQSGPKSVEYLNRYFAEHFAFQATGHLYALRDFSYENQYFDNMNTNGQKEFHSIDAQPAMLMQRR